MVNGKEIKGMAMVCKNGLMEQSMKASGRTIKLMVKALSIMQTGMSLKVNGSLIKRTAMEFTYTLMEQDMKDTGRMTYKMAMGQSHGQMVRSMKGTIVKDRNKVKALILGTMVLLMKETGMGTKSMEG